MKKVLFIDRDGTIVDEPDDYQLDSWDKLEFLKGVFNYLKKISSELNFELVMVTNQDGLGTVSFPEESFWPIQKFIINSLLNEGISFSNIFIDKSFEKEKLNTRKPGVGMLTKYINSNEEYDIKNSYVIGDRITDMELAKNLGCKGILIDSNLKLDSHDKSSLKDIIICKSINWKEIYSFLKKNDRKTSIKRKTKETNVLIEFNIDGNGISNINTGIKFFDHMLEQISRHGFIDLDISVKGDLEVDEHHTIEDVALALGTAINTSIGNKIGIERYGFTLPMDDCLAQVAIDFGGRNWLVWDAEFKREKIGDMPTEMFFHFFKSFSDSAKVNLNIKAEGTNEHHKIESIFKAFSKAIRAAIKRDKDKMILPSTKGLL
ncbi:MAG: bifunctional histidinol-phosphatase/imidazoleglycerol-phosphate dehydratase HisB [Flavobacteriaceae bacterium]|nr:bifunctional histidinol-phosphatase/imidazoleglycerol-phosphate dehydratase HisB [Flavobacteriaceae bacterium]